MFYKFCFSNLFFDYFRIFEDRKKSALPRGNSRSKIYPKIVTFGKVETRILTIFISKNDFASYFFNFFWKFCSVILGNLRELTRTKFALGRGKSRAYRTKTEPKICTVGKVDKRILRISMAKTWLVSCIVFLNFSRKYFSNLLGKLREQFKKKIGSKDNEPVERKLPKNLHIWQS